LAGVLVDAATAGYLDAAHDLSEGGLAQALSEAVLRHGVGALVTVKHVHDEAFVGLFSESAGRVLVSVVPGSEHDFLELASRADVPVARLGRVDTDIDGLVVDHLFDVDLVTLRDRHTGTLPAVLDH
jgi:phosphoribosylformylglycinamidine synthase